MSDMTNPFVILIDDDRHGGNSFEPIMRNMSDLQKRCPEVRIHLRIRSTFPSSNPSVLTTNSIKFIVKTSLELISTFPLIAAYIPSMPLFQPPIDIIN